MGAEMAALGRIVAGDDVALDPGRLELEGLADFRHQPAVDPRPDRRLRGRILDHQVAAALVAVVVGADRPAFPFHHEAAVVPPRAA